MADALADVKAAFDNAPDIVDSPKARSDTKALLWRWFDLTRTKDLDGLSSIMAEDIVIELPFNESGRTEDGAFRRYSGKAAAVGFWAAAFKAEGKLHGVYDAELTMAADGRVTFVEAHAHLTMADGKDYRNRYVFRFVVAGDKVAHVKEYYNPITSAHAFVRPIAGKVIIDSL